MAKFNKTELIASLEEQIEECKREHEKELAEYPAKLEAWKAKALAYATEEINAGRAPRFDPYNGSSAGCYPPPEPVLMTGQLTRAIQQLRMMTGDDVSLRQDDSLLQLALR